MEATKCTPALRFKGFTDPWEQRKFSDLYRAVSEKNDLTYGRDRIISVAKMHFNSAVYVTDDSYLMTYNVMRLGDIAFEGNRSKQYAHGRFVENTVGDGIVSHVFKVFRPISPYDLFYWKYAINNELIMRDLLTRSTKASTMMHELVSSDFLEEHTFVPPLPEQHQIGAFFQQLDDLITLHQRKYESLKAIKQTMLEKLFPQNGSRVPELRFPGFTAPWEQRKVGEVSQLNPVAILPNEFKYVDLESVVGTRMIGYQRENKDTAPSRAQRLAKSGDIFFQTVRPYQKNNYLYELPDENFVFSTGYAQMRPSINGRYFFCLIQKESFVSEVLDHCTGTSYPAINASDLADIIVSIPNSIAEQESIGTFFAQLDNLITLHQRKHEALKAIKQSLLQKMFV